MQTTSETPTPDYHGKVRDIYYVDSDKLLLVASDRLSAFDVVFNELIPGKGEILTSISNHWFSLIDFIPNHIIETDASKFVLPFAFQKSYLQGRSVLVRKANRIDYECVVRGYLMGSAFKEYQKTGTVAGEVLPPGLQLGSRLPHPIFSPATKNETGHDENITFMQMVQQLGEGPSNQLKELSIKIYSYATDLLFKRGLLLLDTKFEFGYIGPTLVLIDEVLTPDSSRFCFFNDWQQALAKGEAPPTSDKQIIRDYLESINWDKEPPAPSLPNEIIQKTVQQYKRIQKEVLCLTKP